MKKRLFALASALVLTFGMSVSVFAADSASAGGTSTVAVVSVDENLSQEDLQNFANATEVSSTVAVTKTALTTEQAQAAATEAKRVVGANAAIATMLDINATISGPTDFTIAVPTVKAGQRIVVLHQKANGTWETIDPKNVADGSVTFTLSSLSPIAIVINNASETTTVAANQAESVGPAIDAALAYLASAGATGTAPKTGDVMMIMAIMASICLAGSVVFTKKAVR